MTITELLAADTAWLADVVYPFLAFSCALTCVLALGWYFMPPRPRHPLNLVIALIAGSMVVPAILASMATGTSPTLDFVSIRTGVRLAFGGVALAFCWPAAYYIVRFWLAWSKRDTAARGQLKLWLG